MSDTTVNSREAVLTYLLGTRCHVKVTVNPVLNGVVKGNLVEVHDAPPSVLREIVNNFVMVSLRPGGLLIPVTEAPPQPFPS